MSFIHCKLCKNPIVKNADGTLRLPTQYDYELIESGLDYKMICSDCTTDSDRKEAIRIAQEMGFDFN